jgi:hypothetical protein
LIVWLEANDRSYHTRESLRKYLPEKVLKKRSLMFGEAVKDHVDGQQKM